MKLKVLLTVLVLFLSASAYGTDYYVDANNGSNDNTGVSKDDAFKTITRALSEVLSLQTRPVSINIARGAYDITIGEKFPLEMQSYVSLIGEDRENTIVDASDYLSINPLLKSIIHCEYVNNGLIKNFTLQGGTGIQTCVRPGT